MRAFALSSFSSSHNTNIFHTDLFHGFPDPDGDARDHLPFWGHGVTVPLRLVRNAWRVPDVFGPYGSIVVSPLVGSKLAVVPRVELLPVEWGHVYELEYRAGEFTHEFVSDDPEDPDANMPEQFVLRLPHRPGRAAALAGYAEVLVPRLQDVVGAFPDAMPVPYRLALATTHDNAPRLSAALLRANPIVWDKHYIFSEAAFKLVEPHLDRDYFEVAELEVP